MNRETLTDKQAISILVLMEIGTSTLLGIAVSAKENCWLAIILAIPISLAINLLYANIIINFEGKNIFEICNDVFGKLLGRVFALLFTWYFFFITALIVRDFGEFVAITVIEEIPQTFTMPCLLLLIIYMVKSPLRTLGRWCEIFLPFVLIVLCIPLTPTFSKLNIDNIIPVAYDGIQPIINGMLLAISFPFVESIVLLGVFEKFQNKKSPYKVFGIGVLVSGAILFAVTLYTILVLGANEYTSSYFPTFLAARRIYVRNFLERIEIIIVVSFVFGVFVKGTCFLISTIKGLAYIFNIANHKTIVTPTSVFVAIGAYLLYESNIEILEVPAFTFFCLFIQIGLFIIVFIASKIKKTHKKNT